MGKEALFGKTLTELQQITAELGLPAYTARQISEWLYKKQAIQIDDMTNLSKKVRALIDTRFEVGALAPVKVQVSTDGTRKYLFPTIFFPSSPKSG